MIWLRPFIILSRKILFSSSRSERCVGTELSSPLDRTLHRRTGQHVGSAAGWVVRYLRIWYSIIILNSAFWPKSFWDLCAVNSWANALGNLINCSSPASACSADTASVRQTQEFLELSGNDLEGDGGKVVEDYSCLTSTGDAPKGLNPSYEILLCNLDSCPTEPLSGPVGIWPVAGRKAEPSS